MHTEILFIDCEKIDKKLLDRIDPETGLTLLASNESVISEEIKYRFKLVPGYKSLDFKNGFMEIYNDKSEFFKTLNTFLNKINEQHNLFELIRYELLVTASRYFYKIWILDYILKNYNPLSVCFYTNGNGLIFTDGIVKNFQYNINGTVIKTRYLINSRKKLSFKFQSLKLLAKNGLNAAGKISITKFQTKKIDILFAERSGKSSYFSISVAKHLQTRGYNVGLLALSDNVENKAQKQELNNIIRFNNSINFTDLLKIIRAVNKISYFDSFFHSMIPGELGRVAHKIIYKDFKFNLANVLFKALITSFSIKKSILMAQPQKVLSSSGGSLYGRALCIQGKNLGAESFLIQHGYYNLEPYDKFVLNDKALVWGEFFKRKMINAGISEYRIFITGNIKLYDLYAKFKSIPSNSSVNKPIILYIPPRTGGANISLAVGKEMWSIVKEAFEKVKNNYRLIVKLHPADNHPEIFDVPEVYKGENLYELLAETSIVISSGFTTSLYEACAFDKQLVYIYRDGLFKLPEEIERFRPGYICTNALQLEQYLIDLHLKKIDMEELGSRRRNFVQHCFSHIERSPNSLFESFILN